MVGWTNWFRWRLFHQKHSYFSCVCKTWLSDAAFVKQADSDSLILVEIWMC